MGQWITDPHWGVDSVTPATWQSTSNLTLFDQVRKKKKPAYWGRYIRTPNASGDKSTLTTAEVNYLFQNGCAILPIYNRTVYQRRGIAWRGTFMDGIQDGLDAINAASTLGIPPGVYIWADIEPSWPNVTPAWILGWWSSVFGMSAYQAGLYCTLKQTYVNALVLMTYPELLVERFGAIEAAIIQTNWVRVPNISQRAWIWSFSPHRGNFTDPGPWVPDAPDAGHFGMVKVWQYRGDNWIGGAKVDSDYATQDAVSVMWQPPPVPWES